MKKICIPYPILEPVVDMGCDTDLAIHYSLQIFLLFINITKKQTKHNNFTNTWHENKTYYLSCINILIIIYQNKALQILVWFFVLIKLKLIDLPGGVNRTPLIFPCFTFSLRTLLAIYRL